MKKYVRSVNLTVENVGKVVKSSKKKFTWTLKVDAKDFKVVYTRSSMSGKDRIIINEQVLYQKKEMFRSAFDVKVSYEGTEFRVKSNDRSYKLFINTDDFDELFGHDKVRSILKKNWVEDEVEKEKYGDGRMEPRSRSRTPPPVYTHPEHGAEPMPEWKKIPKKVHFNLEANTVRIAEKQSYINDSAVTGHFNECLGLDLINIPKHEATLVTSDIEFEDTPVNDLKGSNANNHQFMMSSMGSQNQANNQQYNNSHTRQRESSIPLQDRDMRSGNKEDQFNNAGNSKASYINEYNQNRSFLPSFHLDPSQTQSNQVIPSLIASYNQPYSLHNSNAQSQSTYQNPSMMSRNSEYTTTNTNYTPHSRTSNSSNGMSMQDYSAINGNNNHYPGDRIRSEIYPNQSLRNYDQGDTRSNESGSIQIDGQKMPQGHHASSPIYNIPHSHHAYHENLPGSGSHLISEINSNQALGRTIHSSQHQGFDFSRPLPDRISSFTDFNTVGNQHDEHINAGTPSFNKVYQPSYTPQPPRNIQKQSYNPQFNLGLPKDNNMFFESQISSPGGNNGSPFTGKSPDPKQSQNGQYQNPLFSGFKSKN